MNDNCIDNFGLTENETVCNYDKDEAYIGPNVVESDDHQKRVFGSVDCELTSSKFF